MTREARARRFLANPFIWIGIAYFGLTIAYVIGGVALKRVSQETASRAAEQRSQAINQVATCRDGVERGPQLFALIDEIRDNAADRLIATKQAIAADPGGPLAEVRQKSVVRLRVRLVRIDRVSAELRENTPVRSECNALAAKVGVKPPFPNANE